MSSQSESLSRQIVVDFFFIESCHPTYTDKKVSRLNFPRVTLTKNGAMANTK